MPLSAATGWLGARPLALFFVTVSCEFGAWLSPVSLPDRPSSSNAEGSARCRLGGGGDVAAGQRINPSGRLDLRLGLAPWLVSCAVVASGPVPDRARDCAEICCAVVVRNRAPVVLRVRGPGRVRSPVLARPCRISCVCCCSAWRASVCGRLCRLGRVFRLPRPGSTVGLRCLACAASSAAGGWPARTLALTARRIFLAVPSVVGLDAAWSLQIVCGGVCCWVGRVRVVLPWYAVPCQSLSVAVRHRRGCLRRVLCCADGRPRYILAVWCDAELGRVSVRSGSEPTTAVRLEPARVQLRRERSFAVTVAFRVLLPAPDN